jgi:hypothetical protein
MNKFRVVPACEFLAAGDIGTDAITAKAEQVERNARLAEQQRQIGEWQKEQSRMTPRQRRQDERAMLIEQIKSEGIHMAACEREFQKLLRGNAHGND